MSGMTLILTERLRQVTVEGYTTEHDDQHRDCELRKAADCYAFIPGMSRRPFVVRNWPWDWCYWKPSPQSRVRELTKAGALYLAEADRQRRLGHAPTAKLMDAKASAMAMKIDRIQRADSWRAKAKK